MKVVIMGGGKVGYHVAKSLLENGIEIALIEEDAETAKKISPA